MADFAPLNGLMPGAALLIPARSEPGPLSVPTVRSMEELRYVRAGK